MELHEALGQIGEIRRQMARTEVFRGFRSIPVAFSGILAIGASVLQSWWIPEPTRDISSYLTIWIGVAAVGLTMAGLEMIQRARHSTRWAREQTWLATEQFLPCLVAGGLTTIVIVRSAEAELWMLPGLWSIFFALGVFATRRLLPKAIVGVACFYLAAGLFNLTMARDDLALSPWSMGLSFGVGQLLAAAILYRTLERDHGID
ncbi:hypothetical protein P12x_001880 [Tundrisphaera lichenicola]|uniref:hypothetical protein n=1 Tax=Tundrisphaera lichenicola TaxID=2029860 RepID=UPI003EBE8AC1